MSETPNTEDALRMLEEVSERARHMNLSLVKYTVEDVEAVCAALRAVRQKPAALAAVSAERPNTVTVPRGKEWSCGLETEGEHAGEWAAHIILRSHDDCVEFISAMTRNRGNNVDHA